MSFRPMLRPGQGFQKFRVLREEGGLTENRRPTTTVLKPQGEFLGIISQDTPTETGKNKQKVSPISYTIVQRGGNIRARANDILVKQDGTQLRVKGDPRNPGDLGFFTVYKAEERKDLQ